eukprot:TRINITY_DN2511_c3_g1_i1.p1 TRINITY_DN2511_c3_g1~~TRINITY_DN2511_c3_g1_i1.p1  ORF type:complete len:352 (+),score=34.40 TRINITY_DN2511_c3_g1_i1:35-1057(+)
MSREILSDKKSDDRGLKSLVQWLWNQVWFVVFIWWLCALLVVILLKDVDDKAMLCSFANLCVAFPLVGVLMLVRGESTRPIFDHFFAVIAISVFSGLERNLTSCSMYFISASLKTALHAFNVIFTFFVAALLGADTRSKRCLLECDCKGTGLLSMALTLLVSGGVVAAMWKQSQGPVGVWGVLMNIGAGLSYALKFSLVKILLKDGSSEGRPGKVPLAFVMNLITGIVGFAFVPFLDDGLSLPPFFETTLMGVSILVILLAQLKLTELSDALTVSVLQSLHNVIIVLYFAIIGGEHLALPVYAAFAWSTVGAILYAVYRSEQRERAIVNHALVTPFSPKL